MSTGSDLPRPSAAGPFDGTSRRPVPTDVRRPVLNQAQEETSAGGLVVDCSQSPLRAALIGKLDRRGRLMWSMPKGHIEPGETREQAAVREVKEETGIDGKILAEIGIVDYSFVSNGKRIHKTVHHFLMQRTGGEISTEDAEVAAVEFVAIDELADRLIYADERSLLDRVHTLVAELL